MKITKNKKYLPEQTQHTTNSLVISSDLSIQSLYDILTKNPPLINKVDKNNETFLSYALKRKHIDICEFLLTSPIIDMNYKDKRGNTYLHLAICNTNTELISTIIKKGADINAQNINGDTPLHIAYAINNQNIQAILLDNSANVQLTNNKGLTALNVNDSECNSNNCESMLHIDDDNNSICYLNTTDNAIAITQHNKDITGNSNNVEINNTNQSIKIDWSESNVKTHLRNLNLSNENTTSTNQVYAKSFVEAPHIKKHAQNTLLFNTNNNNNNNNVIYNNNISGDTRYNSSANKSVNKEEEDDLFDITGSVDVDSYKKDNNDMYKVVTSQQQDDNGTFNLSRSLNTNPIEEDDDYVNTRVMNSQGVKLSQSNVTNGDNRYDISISGSFMKSKDEDKHIVVREDTEETGNHAMNEDKPSFQDNNNMKQYMDIDDPFTFSSPYIDEVNDHMIEQSKLEKKQTQERFDEDVDEQTEQQKCNNNLRRINCVNTNDRTLKFVLPKQIVYDEDKETQVNIDKDSNTNNTNNNYHLEVFDFPQTPNNNNNNDKNPPLPASSTTTSTSTTITNPHIKHPLYIFLENIHMEKHFNTLLTAGYDDINLLIDQTTKKSMIVKDSNLKSIGLTLPGERAKILISLQEKAKIFPFAVPKKVYYISPNPNQPNQDSNLKKMDNWLTGLKLQDYLMKFIDNGYHSLDLLMLQMQSLSPLTEDILENEFGITKPGYRARIINSLQYEGKNYYKKNKLGILAIDAKGDYRSCDCLIW